MPLLYSLYLSFCKYKIGAPITFVGIKNYRFILTEYPRFWISMRQTLLWTFTCTAFATCISLIFATLIFRGIKGMTFVRSVFYLPVIINGLAVATVVRYMTQNNGWINQFLTMIGLKPLALWDSPMPVFFTILAAQIFSVGGTVVVYLAGLTSISKEYYEAAEIDGAGPIAKFFKITLPMLSSLIYFNVITNIIFIFGSFNVPLMYYGFSARAGAAYLGGPDDVFYHLGLMVYNFAFSNFNMGVASAIGWVMMAISFIMVSLVYKFGLKYVYYEAGDK